MAPRLHVADVALAAGPLALPADAARHAQVLRLQPGDEVLLFDGRGGQWRARVEAMGRRDVRVAVLAHETVERELDLAVTLALVMPAGERMDVVVEKATELGAAAIQPLTASRSVLRLSGERADKRRVHWQAIAAAACEQCGRNRVPPVAAPAALHDWLGALPAAGPTQARWLLAWRGSAGWSTACAAAGAGTTSLILLSGPEGGFTEAEEDAARSRGFVPVGLGARVLRADTAPMAAMAALALQGLTR